MACAGSVARWHRLLAQPGRHCLPAPPARTVCPACPEENPADVRQLPFAAGAAALEAELARDALAAPLLSRAARLARWAGPDTRVGAGGELAEEQLPEAAAELGLDGDEAAAYASEAWRVAVDIGLIEIVDEEEGTVTAGEDLALLTSGAPQDVLGVWLGALDTVLADASVPDLDDLVGAMEDGGEVDLSSLDWDPEAEAEFLDGVLGNLYLLTVGEEGPDEGRCRCRRSPRR